MTQREKNKYKYHLAISDTHIGVGTEAKEFTGKECADLLNDLDAENTELSEACKEALELLLEMHKTNQDLLKVNTILENKLDNLANFFCKQAPFKDMAPDDFSQMWNEVANGYKVKICNQ